VEIIALCAALLTAVFIGFNILYLIFGRMDRFYLMEAVFVSYGIGLAAISLEMLIFYILGMKFNIPGMMIPWMLLFAVNIAAYFRTKKRFTFVRDNASEKRKGGTLSLFLTFGIVFEIFYAFFRALAKPIESYDAIAIYAIKSKIFYLAKVIPADFFSGIARAFPHPDYPLNIPLAEVFVYLSLGNLNDQLVKIIFPLYFVGILCVLYFAMRRFAGRTYALAFTFILASIPQFNAYAANAYLELPLAFYCLLSALFLFGYLENMKDTRALVMSAAMAALAAWTKNEGLMYCVINTFLVFFFTVAKRKDLTIKDIYRPFLYLAVILIVLSPWMFIKARYHISSDEINLANLNPAYLLKQVPKLGSIFYEFQKQFFGPKKWNILWPAVLFILIVNWKKVSSGVQKYAGISILLAISGYILFYMISYVDVAFFASKTWARFLLHFLPVVILWLAYMLKEDIDI